MTIALIYLNLIVALGSAVFGLLALFRPTLLNPAANNSGEEAFFARMYAARAVPFGLVAGILPLFAGGWPVAALLFAAALAQAGDLAIAWNRRIVGMAAGSVLATLVHAALGLLLLQAL